MRCACSDSKFCHQDGWCSLCRGYMSQELVGDLGRFPQAYVGDSCYVFARPVRITEYH